ncbi:MAG TPA: hypothetical protein VIK91_16780, partial [Nannocystis sp.]
ATSGASATGSTGTDATSDSPASTSASTDEPTTSEGSGGTGDSASGTTGSTGTPTTGDPSTGTTPGTTSDATTGDATTGDTAGTTQGVDTDDTTDGTGTTTGPDTTGPDTTGTTGVMPDPPSDIEVVITADNAYAFAYGTETGVSKLFGGVEAITAGQIFNCGEGPEKYIVPAEDSANATYLYIIAWDDSAVTNGVLARFRRLEGEGGGFGENVFTGTPGWEVCATGVKYGVPSGGPSIDVINEYINKCNNGDLDPNLTSGGWVDEVGTPLGAVAFGEDNTTPYDGGPKPGNEFPLVCPADMPAEARWMWFNWDPGNVVSPFMFPGGQNPYHQFLIFRFAAELIPLPQ